jgi:hypothetical protein
MPTCVAENQRARAGGPDKEWGKVAASCHSGGGGGGSGKVGLVGPFTGSRGAP